MVRVVYSDVDHDHFDFQKIVLIDDENHLGFVTSYDLSYIFSHGDIVEPVFEFTPYGEIHLTVKKV